VPPEPTPTPETPENPAHTPETTSQITPGSLELYAIIGGIMLGILLGPAILGRISPALYDRYITCRAEPKNSLADFEEQTFKLQEQIKSSQSSPAHMDEFLARRNTQRQQIMAEDQLESIRAQLTGLSRSVALVLALIAIMVIETVIDPGARLARARLQTARYLLMGFWIALTLAQPVFLAGFPLTFFMGMILLIALSVLHSAWSEKRAQSNHDQPA
jgi:hypothetical protein